MNKRRRFKQKRRSKGGRSLRDLMAARHLGPEDRRELERFTRYLQSRMDANERAGYEAGK